MDHPPYLHLVQALEKTARALPAARLRRLGTLHKKPFYSVVLMSNPSPGRLSVCLSGGIHGDEPAGAWAVAGFLEKMISDAALLKRFRFLLLPCLNPTGYEKGTRFNHEGLDLNRMFRRRSAPKEVRWARQAVSEMHRDRPPDLDVEFHEDVDTHGFYLYELAQPGEPLWGIRVVQAVSRTGPINTDEEIEGMKADHGVIHPHRQETPLALRMKRRRDWPMAFYQYRKGARHTLTLETPVTVPLKQRVEMHLAALGELLNLTWAAHTLPKT
jgi:hypothetical protein